jgi:transcriptional regulator with XRE-family HTH domain
MKYGSRLRELIKISEFNQAELADKIGVSKSTISFWINSEFPPLDGIESVCNAIDMPIYRFFMSDKNVEEFMGIDPEWLEIGKVIQPLPAEVKNLFYNQILAAMKTLKAALLQSKQSQ